jgi:23S rRNA (guanosine2251-2'-O)-methyltransferase
VVGFAEPLPSPSLKTLLDRCDAAGRDPFLVVLDQVQYAQNLGAILRTAALAGVDAVVLPTRRGAPLSPAVQRVAMGGAEQVPVVREGFGSVFKALGKRGILVVGAEADGTAAPWEVDLTGPVAIVMGGEDRGLGHTARQACDHVVAIPLPSNELVNSLNVSVAAGLLIFERVRQLA